MFNPLKRFFNNDRVPKSNDTDLWLEEVWNAYTVVQRRFALGEMSEEDYEEAIEKISLELEKIEEILK